MLHFAFQSELNASKEKRTEYEKRADQYAFNIDALQREKLVLEESRKNEAKLREQVKNLLNNWQQVSTMQTQLQEVSQTNQQLSSEKSRLYFENNDLKK